MGEAKSPLLQCKRTWKQHGQGGLWISDWFNKVAEHADDLAIIHSCASDGINHAGGVCSMNTGSVFGGRPSLGAWVSYGLGPENQNLPCFVVIQDIEGTEVNVVRHSGRGLIRAVYHGTDCSADRVP